MHVKFNELTIKESSVLGRRNPHADTTPAAGADRLRRVVSHAESARAEHVCIIQGMERDCWWYRRTGREHWPASGAAVFAPWRRGPRHSHVALSPGGGRTLSTRSPKDCVETLSPALQHRTPSFLGGRKRPARSQLSRLAPTTTLWHRCAAPPATSLSLLSLRCSLAHARSRSVAERASAPISPISSEDFDRGIYLSKRCSKFYLKFGCMF